MVLVMENRSYGEVVGSPSAPYETRLARRFEVLTDYYGIGHYSLDNYLALVSGRFFPWATADCQPGPGCRASGPNLASQLDAASIPWAAYMGGMAGDCREANSPGALPAYGVRHDPFVYFPAVVRADCAKIRPSSRLLADLDSSAPPDFVWYSPQICHDGGGDEPCATVAAGDRFLARELPAIEATRWYRAGGVVVLTYDEGDGAGQGLGEHLSGQGNHVPTLVISRATEGAGALRSYVNHFGLLGSIEAAYGLACLAEACDASNGRVALVPRP
jgi:hypothetical protein